MQPVEEFTNLVSLFFARAHALGDKPFLGHKSEGRWQSLSWAETARQVAALASGLRAEGIQAGETVAIVSENRPEFGIADLAIMAIGAISVPTYTTNTTRDHEHILTDSGAAAVIVSSAKLARVVMPALLRSNVRLLVVMEDIATKQQAGSARQLRWDALIAAHQVDVADFAAGITATRSDTACIIYTSGTGGAPRGVMQHHGAILLNVEGCIDVLTNDFPPDDHIFLSFLPLSHAYEHSGGLFLPIGLGAQICYAEGLDKLASNIEEVRPTVMIVVPRLFEVLRSRVMKMVEKQGRVPQLLLAQAVKLGALEARGKLRPWHWPVRALIQRTLVPKVQARFGGRIMALVSGGAPLNPEVGIFFQSLGFVLLQGYGQTEAGPVISVNRPSAGIDVASVGPAMKGVEVRIAEDGEILVRGDLVMKGYWRNPAESANVLQDGWLHTGDIGRIDERGRIYITDRKKDLIVNDKGENISPQKVEGMLTLQPEIAQAMVIGDKRPYLVGLIVPEADWMAGWAKSQSVAAEVGSLRDNPAFHSALRAAIDRVNAELTVTERVRQFIFADEPFAVENEQMTPSLKIRRHAIRAVYQTRLDALYKS